jgi:two-component system sensor histidine kinase HydH
MAGGAKADAVRRSQKGIELSSESRGERSAEALRSPCLRIHDMDQQQYTELAELAGGFIHEIKNHLSTFSLNLQLLGEDFQEPQNLRERRALERVQRLQKECQRLVEVSNDFLRFARIMDLHLEPTDLATIVEDLVVFFGPMAVTDKIDIKVYFPSDLPLVPLDRDMFKQALLNLLLNAQQAMPTGGELTIQAARDGDHVVMNLIDTGNGMAPEVVAKAFQPFYSTRNGGTGLGLPTTRKIVQGHGGTIEVQSEIGRGTKFTIRLPAALENVAGAPAANEGAA